jgi:hypothetical protein
MGERDGPIREQRDHLEVSECHQSSSRVSQVFAGQHPMLTSLGLNLLTITSDTTMIRSRRSQNTCTSELFAVLRFTADVSLGLHTKSTLSTITSVL